MKRSFSLSSRSGVTLIELLVVILIIIILSVALLPVLKPFVVKAKYAAEGIPAVGHIRTLVAMHYTEKDVLPGVQSITDPATAETLYAATSQSAVRIAAAAPDADAGNFADTVQSMRGNGDKIFYKAPSAATGTPITDTDILSTHFANQVELSATDLLGKNAKPDQFQYMVMDSGFKDTSYAYAVGVFGKGGGIAAGTGYAVVEIVNAKNTLHPKITAVWQRYKEEKSTGPIILVVQSAAASWGINGKSEVLNELPIASELIDTTGNGGGGAAIPDDSTFLSEMKLAGWEFFF